MNEQVHPIFNCELDPRGSVPLYAQLASLINSGIASGALKVGNLLPSEAYFCESLHLSRSTVRKALAQLQNEGKIVRLRGKGTFITKPKLRRNLNNLYNFSNEMRELGIHPSSDVLQFEVIRSTPFIARQLRISENDPIYKIKRLRKGDGKPLLLETAYIPVVFCTTLSWENLNDSLYSIISEYTGALPAEATEIYEAICLREKDAAYLQCKAGTPAFQISRTSTNTNGDIFEFSTILAPGDRNKYEITLRRNDVIFSDLWHE